MRICLSKSIASIENRDKFVFNNLIINILLKFWWFMVLLVVTCQYILILNVTLRKHIIKICRLGTISFM